MRSAEIFTVRRVASPLLDLGSWVHATVDMNGPITNDSVILVDCDNFTVHLLLSFFLVFRATVTTFFAAIAVRTDQTSFAALVANVVHDFSHFLRRFLKPPNLAFFFGCVMWMTRMASFANPCVLRNARLRA